MLRYFQRLMLALAIGGAVNSALAFSLLGPSPATGTANPAVAWQAPVIGYDPLGWDIGGPMNLGEEYRWNINTIVYGFDESFLNYFGQRGVDEINKAIAILNHLPPFSQMSSNLSEYPMDTTRENYRASALQLYDLKSIALAMLVEEMGLASPERYVWTLRAQIPIAGTPYFAFLVIKRNFDPVTWAPSSYVNGVLYTYAILTIPINGGGVYYDAVEVPVDPLAFAFTAVVSAIDRAATQPTTLDLGAYFVGLTRDDVGGLRYLYRPSNYNIEGLIPGTTGSALGSDPWAPPSGGGSNSVVNVALRPGVDHITFQQSQYDSMLGSFIVVTNDYQDTYVTNYALVTQTTERVLIQPDILFMAADLGLTSGGFPVSVARTVAAAPAWVNNDALNGQATLAGPGVIEPQINISFNKIGPWGYNEQPFFLDEFNIRFPFPGFVWGSFDGTTNDPVVYPIGSSIQDLERQVLGGP